MKVCTSCNAPNNDINQFCSKCGSTLESAPVQNTPIPTAQEQVQQPYFNVQPQHMSMGGWFGRMCIPFIPIVGPLVYIIMLFVWAFGDNKNETFKNWAKATLIFAAIIFALYIVLFAALGSFIFTGIFDALNNY